MLKLARRTAQAERQVARRAAKAERMEQKIEQMRARETMKRARAEVKSQLYRARAARREDWEMGPLAPRRDTALLTTPRLGAAPETSYWSSINAERAKTEFPRRPQELEARCAWAGGAKHLCLAVGDRVVVTEGPHKGKIGPIKEISKEYGVVTVDGVAVANVTLPEFITAQESQRPVQTMETSIPIDAIRLVHPLADPATGATRDVVIRELRPAHFSLDKPTRRLTYARIVPGLNVSIPWPRRVVPEQVDHACDTLRIDAEARTFVPTLLRPPMPEAVVDELRNRYSRFRTRHEAAYVARKEAEARREKALRGRGGAPPELMRTPLEEFHLQQKALRRARGQPVLTDEMLAAIGEVIARNRARVLDAAGAAGVEVSGSSGVVPESNTAAATESRPPPPS